MIGLEKTGYRSRSLGSDVMLGIFDGPDDPPINGWMGIPQSVECTEFLDFEEGSRDVFESVGGGQLAFIQGDTEDGVEGLLAELRTFVAEAAPSDAIFRTNHASNYLPIAGRLPRDRDRLLGLLDAALGGDVPLRPEWLRGL